MTVADTGPRSTGKIVLRGINSGDSSVDGANANSGGGRLSRRSAALSRFQAARHRSRRSVAGSTGHPHGLGTLAGAVRYMPSRPDAEHYSVDLHGRWFGESTAAGGVNADGTVNIPIVKDHIALRSTVGYLTTPAS
jgi:hypothetical protein